MVMLNEPCSPGLDEPCSPAPNEPGSPELMPGGPRSPDLHAKRALLAAGFWSLGVNLNRKSKLIVRSLYLEQNIRREGREKMEGAQSSARAKQNERRRREEKKTQSEETERLEREGGRKRIHDRK
eukprot:6194277-Pleurochrysis_carterae.AAC.1